MTLGTRITELRKERAISQGDLARELDVSRQAVSKWEQGQSTPDPQKLLKLAELLQTDVQYLATGVKTEPPAPIIEERIVVREVIRHVPRAPVKANPLDKYLIAGGGFLLGLLVGLLF